MSIAELPEAAHQLLQRMASAGRDQHGRVVKFAAEELPRLLNLSIDETLDLVELLQASGLVKTSKRTMRRSPFAYTSIFLTVEGNSQVKFGFSPATFNQKSTNAVHIHGPVIGSAIQAGEGRQVVTATAGLIGPNTDETKLAQMLVQIYKERPSSPLKGIDPRDKGLDVAAEVVYSSDRNAALVMLSVGTIQPLTIKEIVFEIFGLGVLQASPPYYWSGLHIEGFERLGQEPVPLVADSFRRIAWYMDSTALNLKEALAERQPLDGLLTLRLYPGLELQQDIQLFSLAHLRELTSKRKSP